MKRLLLPLAIALVGLGGGLGAGLMLKPEPDDDVALTEGGTDSQHGAHEAGEQAEAGGAQDRESGTPSGEAAHAPHDAGHAGSALPTEYVKLNNQFIVPVLREGRVAAMVVMSLSLETALGGKETVYAQEPKIRDGFLRVMFDHANAGGFEGNFTTDSKLEPLRKALRETGRRQLGDLVVDVLVTDISRQDV